MQQLLLDFPHNTQYLTEDYIVTDSNSAAYDIISSWPYRWGVYPYQYFVLLHGSNSSGKTHLAHIWQRRSRAYFVNPNEELLEPILDNYGYFILEDIDNKIWEENYLFHIFNKFHELKKYTLFTSKLSPLEINFTLKDLNSRIKSILSISIACPSEELLKIMLLKHFSERELKVPLEVINFLVTRIPRECSEIIHIVDLIDKAALLNKRNITIPLVKDILEV